MEMFNRALKLNPRDVEALTNKDVTYVLLENNEEGMKCFDKAIKINKNSAEAHHNKGRIYATQGNFERALQCFNTAIFIDPDFQEAFMNRAHVLFDQGNFEESIKNFDKLSLKHELAQLFLLNKGDTFHHHNRLDEAIKCYDKCMSIKEDTDEYRKSLLEKARILMRIEHCNEATPLYEKLANSKNIDRDLLEKTYLFMGDNFYLMKKYDEAIASYKKSIELDSTDPKTREKVCDILYTLKRYLYFIIKKIY